jgi:two-component sensor histidine kinase/GAF domain-containing protein
MAVMGRVELQSTPAKASTNDPGAEDRRLAALRRYGVLDTTTDTEFDGFTTFAAELLGAPIALMSFLDHERQWFKSRLGFDLAATPRAWAFCDHTLRERAGEILVVPDATLDPRFSTNPLVLGGPRLRFYAGTPLLTPEGVTLGTLCVLSPEPRPSGLSAAERRHLARLAAMAMAALELRRDRLRVAQIAADAESRRGREERLRLALEIAGACAWELDPTTGISTWDPAARALLGLPETVAFEDGLRDFVHPEDVGRVRAAVAAALDPAGDGRYAVEHRVLRSGPDGHPRWFQSLGQAWFEEQRGARRATRLVCATMEVTDRRAAAGRQALLVAELNHRVKNTLAVVLAIAEQTRRATDTRRVLTSQTAPHERRRFHADFQARLLALSRTHDLLTRDAWQGASLAELVCAALAPFERRGEEGTSNTQVDGPDVELAPEPAVALSIALHELAANAVRHGALSAPGGRVSVTWQATSGGGQLELAWVESGGPPPGGVPRHRGFGANLLGRGLGRQLGGEVTLDYAAEGLRCRMRLPLGRLIQVVRMP